MRLCKFHFSIVSAMINPPRYKKTYLCPNDAVVASTKLKLVHHWLHLLSLQDEKIPELNYRVMAQ